jgi:uncharacterized protein YdeI (YjbR/CyaY-like superfamily)
MLVNKDNIQQGTVHNLPDDILESLKEDLSLAERWNDLTPLARNEWICWTISVKKPETRKKHIERIKTDLLAGKRRPCCWAGCIHRNKN